MLTRIKILIPFVTMCFVSCGDYLEIKPDRKMVIPSSLEDLQALLNNTRYLNCSEESLGEMSADNYYLKDVNFNALHEGIQMTYIWHKDVSLGEAGWSSYYRIILYANQVLASLEDIQGDDNKKAILKGKALFFRANAYYHLAQLFTIPYNRQIAEESLGLPLRLSPGISETSVRANLQQTYEQILSDFLEAVILLPNQITETTTQPNKAAAYQGLARTYLLMGDYEKALSAALSSLEHYSSLVDYNNIDLSDSNPLGMFNEETVYFSQYGSATLLHNSVSNVDTTLYQLYADEDLRKVALFARREDGTIRFRGSYSGDDSEGIFNGMTTAESLLLAAECLARLGDLDEAVQKISTLLLKRYRQGEFKPIAFRNREHALRFIFDERRKELLFRGSRWIDLRRLNLEESFSEHIVRYLNGEKYELAPNDRRYVFRIPDEVIRMTGMLQNER